MGLSPADGRAAFWPDVVINFLFLLGPAVEDSANGKDVYKAFAVRFSLFVVSHACMHGLAIAALEWLRGRGPKATPIPAAAG